MPRKSSDRAAANEAIAAHAATKPEAAGRSLPLPSEVANALAVIAKRNGKTQRQALSDLAAALDLQSALQALSLKYRAEADAELSSLFKPAETEG